MKIGILTQPLHANYGGILQNYALQQVLKQIGHEVWTIDYGKFTWINWLDNAWRVLVHKMLGHKVRFAITPSEKDKIEAPLRRFAEENIQLTKPRCKKFCKIIIRKYAFDALVVGSDQVWRPMYNYNVEDCFLSFVSKMDIKRVAYAASFGTDKWEFTPKQTEHCAVLAKKFDGISVREKSGIALCDKYLGVKATHVLDPTLLLQAENYVKLCSHISKREPFIFAYVLDVSEDKIKSIVNFAERRGLPYIIKSADNTVSDADTIELWLSYFRDATFVVTDSFHGTAFSIIFNKNFYVFGNEKRGNSRFDSLLETFGLKDRMVNNVLPEKIDNINWEEVNKKREAAIINSKLWLKQNLRICQK